MQSSSRLSSVLVPQFRHPFSRLPVLHLGIMQTGSHQHVGIRLRPHAVIGTVAFHIMIIGFILRISHSSNSPVVSGIVSSSMVVTTSTNGTGYHAMEQLWPFIHGHAHQHSAGAAPCRSRAADRRTGKQRVTDVQIVVEGIFLTQEFTVFIPLLTQLAAAADVGDGVDSRG